MSVKIGHASIDENGKAKGGKAGDQNGKEVCIRDWYNKPWDVVLRPKSNALAENSARICEQICNDNHVGYDQNQRNTLWTNYLKTKKVVPTEMVETDCSAFMTYCAILGGANITYGSNAPTTRTMRSIFGKSGNYDVITDKKYTSSSDLLKRGDILVKEGSHTVMVLSNGNGKATVNTKSISLPSGILKIGAKGQNVKLLQIALNTLFDAKLKVDGEFGNKTYSALVSAQTKLSGMKLYSKKIDGEYGSGTRNALISLAKSKGYSIV